MNNAPDIVSTEDGLDGFPDVTVGTCAAITPHLDATSNGSQLIKGEFGVRHWIELLWRSSLR